MENKSEVLNVALTEIGKIRAETSIILEQVNSKGFDLKLIVDGFSNYEVKLQNISMTKTRDFDFAYSTYQNNL